MEFVLFYAIIINGVISINILRRLPGENQCGNYNTTNFLINKGADINLKNKNEGRSPLFYAILNNFNNTNITELLIQKGAEINIQDNKGNTPLHCAAYKGFADLAEYLIRKGAHLYTENSKDETPYDMAKRYKKTALYKVLKVSQ